MSRTSPCSERHPCAAKLSLSVAAKKRCPCAAKSPLPVAVKTTDPCASRTEISTQPIPSAFQPKVYPRAPHNSTLHRPDLPCILPSRRRPCPKTTTVGSLCVQNFFSVGFAVDFPDFICYYITVGKQALSRLFFRKLFGISVVFLPSPSIARAATARLCFFVVLSKLSPIRRRLCPLRSVWIAQRLYKRLTTHLPKRGWNGFSGVVC